MAVMGFNDFNVVVCGQSHSSHLQQLQSNVHAHAHIRRHDDGNISAGSLYVGFLCIAKTRGANHHLHTEFTAHFDMRHGAFRPGKVDQYMCVLQTDVQI